MKRIALILVAVVIVIYVGLIFIPMDPVERRPGTGLSGDLASAQDTELVGPRGPHPGMAGNAHLVPDSALHHGQRLVRRRHPVRRLPRMRYEGLAEVRGAR